MWVVIGATAKNHGMQKNILSVATDKIIEHAASFPAKAIVVTGGEPLLYNLDYLCQGLNRKGVMTFLETSGSSELSGEWDWICLSPKKDAPPLAEIFMKANELKVIIEDTADLGLGRNKCQAGFILPVFFIFSPNGASAIQSFRRL